MLGAIGDGDRMDRDGFVGVSCAGAGDGRGRGDSEEKRKRRISEPSRSLAGGGHNGFDREVDQEH